jgi:hypothetical protein
MYTDSQLQESFLSNPNFYPGTTKRLVKDKGPYNALVAKYGVPYAYRSKEVTDATEETDETDELQQQLSQSFRWVDESIQVRHPLPIDIVKELALQCVQDTEYDIKGLIFRAEGDNYKRMNGILDSGLSEVRMLSDWHRLSDWLFSCCSNEVTFPNIEVLQINNLCTSVDYELDGTFDGVDRLKAIFPNMRTLYVKEPMTKSTVVPLSMHILKKRMVGVDLRY